MPWPEVPEPERMQRVAVVAADEDLQQVLVELGRAGQVELDASRPSPDEEPGGETPLEQVVQRMVRSGPVAATTGWCPVQAVSPLAAGLARRGGVLVRLPAPAGTEPPTLIAGHGPARAFQPLVDTYGTLPYRDINPATFAGLAYVAMFGMMFGDVGHGLLLLGAGLALRAGRPARLAGWSRLAPFAIGCGVSSALGGLLYGEAFGPTGLVPVLWQRPLDHPTTLLGAALIVGAVLLAASYAIGIANRWREAGPLGAVVAVSGVAGAALYAGLGTAVLGVLLHRGGVVVAGAVVAGAGLAVGFAGCFAAAGGRGTGLLQATVEMFDATLRIGSNTVSFTRLAAFGMTDAALGQVIWDGTVSIWHRGAALWAAAGLLFVVGHAAAFALEGLVAGVQALRLEYYEMFSRVLVTEGRPFRPWRLPRGPSGGPPPGEGSVPFHDWEATCSPG